MNKNLTELVLVVDRSGSMQSMKNDAEGGINSLIEKQKTGEGQCNLTLYQFDNEYECLFNDRPLNENTSIKYNLVPRGGTALLDAIGRAINEVGSRLATVAESNRPGLIYFCIVTDGYENASKEFTREKIKEMIKHQTDKYSWKFDFIGAGDSFLQGQSLGFESFASYNVIKTASVYSNIGSKLGRMRGQSVRGQSVQNCYTPEELKDMQ